MWKIIQHFNQNKFFLILLLFCFVSCNRHKTNEIKDNKLASVGESHLYRSDLKSILETVSGDDSVLLVQRYINDWVKKELLLQTAKMNLTDSEQDIKEQVREYEASLLINQYKYKLINNSLDTVVTIKQVEKYIGEHPDNFYLKVPLYQYYYARVLTKNKRDLNTVYNLFKEKNVNFTQEVNIKNTTLLSIYDEGWYTLEEIVEQLFKGFDISKLRLKKGKIFSTKDKKRTYYIRPINIIKKGELAPAQYIYSKVKQIILYNRKISLSEKLENEIYKHAKKNNSFKIY